MLSRLLYLFNFKQVLGWFCRRFSFSTFHEADVDLLFLAAKSGSERMVRLVSFEFKHKGFKDHVLEKSIERGYAAGRHFEKLSTPITLETLREISHRGDLKTFDYFSSKLEGEERKKLQLRLTCAFFGEDFKEFNDCLGKGANLEHLEIDYEIGRREIFNRMFYQQSVLELVFSFQNTSFISPLLFSARAKNEIESLGCVDFSKATSSAVLFLLESELESLPLLCEAIIVADRLDLLLLPPLLSHFSSNLYRCALFACKTGSTRIFRHAVKMGVSLDSEMLFSALSNLHFRISSYLVDRSLTFEQEKIIKAIKENASETREDIASFVKFILNKGTF